MPVLDNVSSPQVLGCALLPHLFKFDIMQNVDYTVVHE